MITQERLKELLNYDPLTGQFTWRVNRQSVRAGDIAGSMGQHGYRVLRADSQNYRSHRLAWIYCFGYEPKQIDHIDRDKTNNAISNLREVEDYQNKWNVSAHKLGKSNLRGAILSSNPFLKKRPWFSKIRLNGKLVYLGYFATPEEAAAAYEKAAKAARGEFYAPPALKSAPLSAPDPTPHTEFQ